MQSEAYGGKGGLFICLFFLPEGCKIGIKNTVSDEVSFQNFSDSGSRPSCAK